MIIIWKCLIDSFLIVSIVTYFILSFQVCLVKFLWKILSAMATLDGLYVCMYNSKCSTYSSLSLTFLLEWSQFLRLFFFLWKSGRRASQVLAVREELVLLPPAACSESWPVISVSRRGEETQYNDGLLFYGNHQALSSDQSLLCWRLELNLIIHLHLIFLPTHFPNGIVARRVQSGPLYCLRQHLWKSPLCHKDTAKG